MNSKIPFAISHAPGHMFITDIPDPRMDGLMAKEELKG
jgi:hypothetical protein